MGILSQNLTKVLYFLKFLLCFSKENTVSHMIQPDLETSDNGIFLNIFLIFYIDLSTLIELHWTLLNFTESHWTSLKFTVNTWARGKSSPLCSARHEDGERAAFLHPSIAAYDPPLRNHFSTFLPRNPCILRLLCEVGAILCTGPHSPAGVRQSPADCPPESLSSPVQSSPVQSCPVQSSPVQSCLVQSLSSPVQFCPVQSSPV